MVLARESKDEIAGPLRIVGPKSSFVAILMPLLDEFCRAHPGIQPDIQLDDGIGNWVLDRVDVGFRFGASPNEGVIGRQLFPIRPVDVTAEIVENAVSVCRRLPPPKGFCGIGDGIVGTHAGSNPVPARVQPLDRRSTESRIPALKHYLLVD